MGRLVNAEFRKILTTKLWWGLLIPAVVLGFGWAWGASALTSEIVSELDNEPVLRQFDISLDGISWSVIALVRGFNIASVLPMIFGALAVAGEINQKTITTTFLTAPSRLAAMGAKSITYAVWGAVYGVVIGLGVTLGTLVGSDSTYLPDAGQWFLILLAGVIMCVLWTLVGLGVGALIGSATGAVVILLVYALVIGPFGELVIFGATDLSALPGLLPNGSANGLTGSTAAALLFDQIQDTLLSQGGPTIDTGDQSAFEDAARIAAGAAGSFAVWISGLIFLAWTALFVTLGILRNRNRDIT